ncbi:uncharacterized protein [Ptychodera flava]|uniref:uncharacterized protein n=1 Tax=Ptychodera flava TaxID=63121 RepID=UPI00396A4981
MEKAFVLSILLVCMYTTCVQSLECVSCDYDEVWYDTNRACLTDPSSITTVSCDTQCYTYAYYESSVFSDAPVLNVKRGCATSNQFADLDNECDNRAVYSIYEGYVCTCNDTDSCNAVDTGYHRCHQCNTDDDSTIMPCEANDDNLHPCLGGEQECGALRVDYDSWVFTDVTYRYCTSDTADDGGDCEDDTLSRNCAYSCREEGCNAYPGGAACSTVSLFLMVAMLFLASRV